eukprot:scaffold73318_cov75-Phaeocystis_antarctica.AAC.2
MPLSSASSLEVATVAAERLRQGCLVHQWWCRCQAIGELGSRATGHFAMTRPGADRSTRELDELRE